MNPSLRVLLTALMVALGGCGADEDADAPPADLPESVVVPWVEARPAAGGEALRIGYVNDPCTRAREASVEETGERVTVTLFDPERDPAEVCIQRADPGCVRVPLERPLAGREVVDGAPDRLPRTEPDVEDGLPFSRYGRCRPVPLRP